MLNRGKCLSLNIPICQNVNGAISRVTHPRVSLVLRKSKQGSSMCIWKNKTKQNNWVKMHCGITWWTHGTNADIRWKKGDETCQNAPLTAPSACAPVRPWGLTGWKVKTGGKHSEHKNKMRDLVGIKFNMSGIWKAWRTADVCVCAPGSTQWLQNWRLLYWVTWLYRCGASEEAPPLWTSPAPLLATWRTATYCQEEEEERGWEDEKEETDELGKVVRKRGKESGESE